MAFLSPLTCCMSLSLPRIILGGVVVFSPSTWKHGSMLYIFSVVGVYITVTSKRLIKSVFHWICVRHFLQFIYISQPSLPAAWLSLPTFPSCSLLVSTNPPFLQSAWVYQPSLSAVCLHLPSFPSCGLLVPPILPFLQPDCTFHPSLPATYLHLPSFPSYCLLAAPILPFMQPAYTSHPSLPAVYLHFPPFNNCISSFPSCNLYQPCRNWQISCASLS